MKFTKPINREVEIDGTDFVLSFSDIGIELRIKGKRKTARVAWPQVLDIAASDSGETARELFGVSAAAAPGQPQPAANTEGVAQSIALPTPEPQADGNSAETVAAARQSEDLAAANRTAETNHADEQARVHVEGQGLAASAGDAKPES